MQAFMDRVRRALLWRFSEARRHLADHTGALRYELQRRSGRIRTYDGAQPAGAKLAVYTIFPQSGLLPSHRLALECLTENGYAPLVVSNLPLGAEARHALAPLVWKFIERPNFGRDIGAYREAMRALGDRLGRLDRLILLNDSVWFPLPGGADWPQRAESLGVDLAAAVSNYGVPVPPDGALEGFIWRYDPQQPEFHYCSFALSLGPAALRHPAFARFWEELRLTEHKVHLVRRGELGLSRALIDAGLSHGETFETAAVGARVAGLPRDALLALIGALIIPSDRDLEAARLRILAAPDAYSDAALVSAALSMIAQTGPGYVFPGFAHEVMRHPFLKKSPLWQSRSGAEATLRLTARLPGAGGAVIHEEACALARQHFGCEITPIEA